ncbi:coiled-coil domain-containing protein 115-like [Watersipora subatra]|uniref:coiled-coil domain-containing protein 115-like n=1 Tax=Watersipora subatra TaxID=2589382 RepID=UPI00355C05D7
MAPEVCKKKLDSIIDEIFAHLSDLSSLRRQLDKELRDGYLQMAKARSNMGQKSISSLQYDERQIEPSIFVEVNKEGAGPHSFNISKDALQADLDSTLDGTSLRKRSTKCSEVIETVGPDFVESEPADGKSIAEKKAKDPLLMFGVLVPQALRMSKSCFERSIPVITKICSTQAVIVCLKNEYLALRSQL